MKQSRANTPSGIHRMESLLNTQSSNGKHSKANMALRQEKRNRAGESQLITSRHYLPEHLLPWRGIGKDPSGPDLHPLNTCCPDFGLAYILSDKSHLERPLFGHIIIYPR